MAPERLVIGVDIGGTKVAAALVRGRLPGPDARTSGAVETPEIVDRFTMLTDVSSPEATVRGIEACIADLEHGSGRVEGIGVGVASMVDFAAGRIVESVNLPLADVPLRRPPSGQVRACPWWWTTTPRRRPSASGCTAPAPVCATCHAHARHGGGGRHHQRRPPTSGGSGAAGELGHIIVEFDGLECPANCPNRGCLEA